MPIIALLIIFVAGAATAHAETLTLKPTAVTEWKAVYGRVEARDLVPARARIGGLIVELDVSEGDRVKAGQKIAKVRDDKIAFQIAALDARLRALQSQSETAQAELALGQTLVERGVATRQRIDQLRTQVDVVRNDIAAVEAERLVLVQRTLEGEVLAPTDGTVLKVPTTRGTVIRAGEEVAMIGGGGVFLRLAIPERHATRLQEGAKIYVTADGIRTDGRLAKIYPQIENGRVISDVEVASLDTDFIDARVLVRVPVGERNALLVPKQALTTRFGIDFVNVEDGAAVVERAVVSGTQVVHDGEDHVEILTGLKPGDRVVLP
ncbi:MAG: efflux RND transporter periplasmic adaptor subunit [Pseudomonadota bacterium]